MDFNLLDIVICLVLLCLFVRGLMVGFFRGAASIVSLVAGFYVATYYYEQVLDLLTHLAPNLEFANIISFVAVFLVIYLVLRVAIGSALRLLNPSFFGKWDRLLGALLGLGKGVLVVSFLTVSLIHLLPPESVLMKDSRLSPYSLPICRYIVRIVPAKFKEDFLQKVKNQNPQPAATHQTEPHDRKK